MQLESKKSYKKISFELSKNDFLQHLLYSASKIPSVLQKRRRNKIILPIIYLAVSIFGFIQGNFFLVVAMTLMSALWFWAFPKWEKKQYVKQYNQYLDKNLKDEIGKRITLEFNPQEIIQSEENQTFQITYDQIGGWYETKYAVYMGLKDGHTIIIPKKDLYDLEEIKEIVRNNEQGISIPEILDLDWEWK